MLNKKKRNYPYLILDLQVVLRDTKRERIPAALNFTQKKSRTFHT